ncbi:MAG: hypothetical protein ABIH91_01480 [Candidatus Omnitrophota bacterium]
MIIKNKGIALIAAIMLIVFVSIVVLGLSTFIVQWYKQIDVEERRARCIYNAMAGVHYSLYQYRNNATLVNDTINIDANNNFTLSTVSIGGSGAAANLIIDATAAYLSSNRKDVLGITLTNTSLTTAITLSQMVIYIDTGTGTLDRVDINGSSVWTVNTLIGTIPITLDMTDVIIPANTMITVDTIRWVRSISATTVHWGFIMSDASATSTCTVYPAPASSCSGSLTIQSMGKTTGSNQYRSVQAAYNTATGNISDYDEIAQTVP